MCILLAAGNCAEATAGKLTCPLQQNQLFRF